MRAVLKELLTSQRPRTSSKSQTSPTFSPSYTPTTPYDGDEFNEDNDEEDTKIKVSIALFSLPHLKRVAPFSYIGYESAYEAGYHLP